MNLEVWEIDRSHAARLLEKYRETGCPDIATELVQLYEGLVRMAASKMSRNRRDLYEDLYQTGQLALYRLLGTYDSSHGVVFEAYALKSIIGQMKNYLRDKSWYIQVPRRIKEKGAMVQQAVDELTVRLERSPMVEEIAAHLELTMEETIEILAGRQYYQYVSLDTPLSAEETGATIMEMIPEDRNDYQHVEKQLDMQEALNSLHPEEKIVVELAYIEGRSQRAIAQELGISQMTVSRILRKALTKLKPLLDESSG